jgi:hypothetical protein
VLSTYQALDQLTRCFLKSTYPGRNSDDAPWNRSQYLAGRKPRGYCRPLWIFLTRGFLNIPTTVTDGNCSWLRVTGCRSRWIYTYYIYINIYILYYICGVYPNRGYFRLPWIFLSGRVSTYSVLHISFQKHKQKVDGSSPRGAWKIQTTYRGCYI